MIIAIDFDGTCVTHEYPKVGKDLGAAPILKRLTDSGHQLILYTMRSGKELEDAVNWFKKRNIPLYGINENPDQKSWTQSPKVYAHKYIDDSAFGCPLIHNPYIQRSFVDWKTILNSFIGLFKPSLSYKEYEDFNKGIVEAYNKIKIGDACNAWIDK